MDCILLTKSQVAKRLGYSSSTIDRLRKSGQLPYRKIFNSVRFIEQDIEDFINNALAKSWQPKNHTEGNNG